jgi:hypothetical protein
MKNVSFKPLLNQERFDEDRLILVPDGLQGAGPNFPAGKWLQAVWDISVSRLRNS